MPIQMTTTSFTEKAKNIHGDKFDYSLVDYINIKTPVAIICPIHGKTRQSPKRHLDGKFGCKPCAMENRVSYQKLTQEEFLTRSIVAHGNRFDYSLATYIDGKTPVKIICTKHGEFGQRPSVHFSSTYGCPKCWDDNRGLSRRFTTEEFIRKAQQFHENRYDYSLVTYVTGRDKVKIICNEHGVFEQSAESHYRGYGCPKCGIHKSKGEEIIQSFLEENDIRYKRFKKFENCRWKGILEFDFYLPHKQILIEYDGKQHFEPNEWFGGQREFEAQVTRDEVKDTFAKENNYSLIRIPYYERNNICNILGNIIA